MDIKNINLKNFFLVILLMFSFSSLSFALDLFDSIQLAFSNSVDMNNTYLNLETEKINYFTNKRRLKFEGSIDSEYNTSDIDEIITNSQKIGTSYGVSIPSILYGDLKVGYSYDMTRDIDLDTISENKTFSISTEVPLIKSGYLNKKKDALSLKIQLESGYDKYIQEKEGIVEKVVSDFFNLYLKKRELIKAEKDYEFQKHLSEIIKNKYAAGSFSRIEVDRIELEMLKSEQNIKILKNSLSEMEKKFFFMLGVEPQEYELGIDLDKVSINTDEIDDVIVTKIVNQNLSLKTLLNNKKLLVLEKESVNFFNQSNVFCNTSFTEDSNYSIIAGLKIPLGDFVQVKSKKQLLDIEIKQLDNSILQTKNNLQENIENIRRAFEQYNFNMEVSKKSIEIAKKILEIDQLNYEKGSLAQDKLLESQENYEQELLNIEKYKIDAIIVRIQLDKLLGNLRDEGYILWLKQ